MFTRNKMARITRIRPKPAYSLFPIVIAKCLHSPQQRSLLRTASVQNLLPALLVSTKFEFHNLRGFDTPIRTDDHFDLHLARDVHAPSKFRVERSDPGLYLAL